MFQNQLLFFLINSEEFKLPHGPLQELDVIISLKRAQDVIQVCTSSHCSIQFTSTSSDLNFTVQHSIHFHFLGV